MDVLKNNDKYKDIFKFAKAAYAKHDAAHNIEHAGQVLLNALTIAGLIGYSLTGENMLIFTCVMLCHDVHDHKQKNPRYTREEIRAFYVSVFGDDIADDIIFIHDNCSWSKRATSRPLVSPRIADWMRLVLQDADWMEAIGDVGLARCIEYTNSVGGNVPEDVCTHIDEKLMLIPDHLNFAESKTMAKSRLAPLIAYKKLHG